jgi:ferritin-like metal-binding protein YciE
MDLARLARGRREEIIMKDHKEILADWLRDAHAMECSLVSMLEKQSDSMSDYPLVQRRLADHALESQRHADRVEECLKQLGQDTSTLKDAMAKMMGKAGPYAMAMASDEPVKIALANYGLEHFEIACYRSLQAAAEHCGESHIAEVAAAIIRDEENMAQFLETEMDEITLHELDHQVGVGADR